MKFSSVLRFVSLAAVLLPLSVQAQLIKGYGAKAGANSSKATFSYFQSDFQYETERRTGVHAAFFLEWGKSSLISLITQVEYAQRGFVEEQMIISEISPEPLGVVRANTRLDYISLPLMIKLQYPRLVAGPYLVFGPKVDWLVHHVAGKFEFPRATFESSLYKVFADRAVSGTVGLGFAADKLLHLPVLLEARYNFVLTDNTDLKTISKAQNQSFDLWLGIKL
jgi:Outer membrane protein beta-barrel domain